LFCPKRSGGGGGSAPGDSTTLKVDGFFTEVDANHDGQINKEEWTAAGLKDMVFSMVDTKKQGYITKDELEASKIPSAMDSTKDGQLTVQKMKDFDKTAGSGGGPGGGAPGGSHN
jgi:Ca2+-binding EF-hand superfamily protein